MNADDARTGDRLTLPDFDFTFRFVEAADVTDDERARMLELLAVAFNGGPSWFALGVEPVEHLRWKAGAFPGTAQVELIEDGDELVGTAIALRRRYLIRGVVAVGRDGVDLAVAPRAQGRGVQSVRRLQMREVWKRLHPGVAFQLSLTSHPASWHLRDRAGTRPFGNALETLTRVLSARRLLLDRQGRDTGTSGPSRTRSVLEAGSSRWRRIAGQSTLASRLFAASLAHRVRRPSLVGHIVALDRFDERAGALWEAVAPSFDFIQVRDQAFLNWRFRDRRAGPFLVRAVLEGDRLLGYAALRVTPREVMIADLLVLPDRLDVAAALLQDAIEVGHTRGCAMVQSWLPHTHPYRDAFRAHGFVTRPNAVGLGFEQWYEQPELDFLDDPAARVHVMPADTDHI